MGTKQCHFIRREAVLRRTGLILLLAALAILSATPVAASPTVSRTVPSSVDSGTEFQITIEVSGCGAFGQVVETLPDGFSYAGCPACDTGDVGFDQTGSSLKFTFLGDGAGFAYTLEAPEVQTSTTYSLHGVVKDEDKNEYPMEDGELEVTAGGSPEQSYALTIEVEGDGSTTPSEGSHSYDEGELVQIRAIPDTGWQFDYWDGDVARESASSTTVTVDDDTTITAVFVEIPPGSYVLELLCEPADGGTVRLSPTADRNRYEEGTSLRLTAMPSQGYAFERWSGDIGGSANPSTLTVQSNRSITAHFTALSHGSAQISASDLTISPAAVSPNQELRISVILANSGQAAGSYQAVLSVNGQPEGSRAVTVSPGSSRELAFQVQRVAPGTYTVTLGGQEGQFTVHDEQGVGSSSQASAFPRDPGVIAAIVFIAALGCALLFVIRRIRAKT